MKRKLLKNALEQLEQFDLPESLPSDELSPQEKYNIANKLVRGYMNQKDFTTQLVKRMDLVAREGHDQPQHAHEFLDKVLQYKLNQAAKKGKKLKNDPRSKAFIDISDCLSSQKELEQLIGKEGLQKRYGTYQYGKDEDNIYTKIKYKGNICIPFDNCYIYTSIREIGCILDIQTNDDGTYSGTIYYLFMDCISIQSKFEISRDGMDWEIYLQMSKFQRPLGYPMCNIAGIICLICFGNLDLYLEQFEIKNDKDLHELVPQFYSSLCRCLLDSLNYLGTYKSKYVYKLTKEDDTMYCYTSRVGEEVQDYMKTKYSGYSYEKLHGWIVNGYWKLLDKKTSGKNKLGKSIRGFDWITPYSDQEKTIVSSREQQANLVPIHAIQRAKERYQLDLSLQDLQEITDICNSGKDITKLTVRDKFGRLPNKSHNSNYTCYRLNYKNTWIDVVFERFKETARITTFLPKPKEPSYPIIDSATYNKVLSDVYK